jgi:cell division protein FtsB
LGKKEHTVPETSAEMRRASKKRATTQEKQAPSSRLIALVGVTLCLLLTVFSLYPVVREYYVAVRTNDQLNAELLAVIDRNAKISEQIANLQTDEGIADRVREEFGWVKAGETAVNITGLAISDSTTALPPTVKSSDIAAEKTWWTNFLDTLFAVEERPTAPAIPDPFLSN